MQPNDYRPTDLDDIIGVPTDKIASMVDGKDTPNMLFYGPPGTGKTTTARAVCRELNGSTDELWEINASDDRGIDMIRDKINRVARLDVGTQVSLSMSIPVVLLDEADSMTGDAYQALRSPMEDTAAVFILTANDRTPIHSAIESRCGIVLEFRLTTSDIHDRLTAICDESDIDVSDDRLIDMAKEANGDMRRALSDLQQHVNFRSPTTDAASRLRETLQAEGKQ